MDIQNLRSWLCFDPLDHIFDKGIYFLLFVQKNQRFLFVILQFKIVKLHQVFRRLLESLLVAILSNKIESECKIFPFMFVKIRRQRIYHWIVFILGKLRGMSMVYLVNYCFERFFSFCIFLFYGGLGWYKKKGRGRVEVKGLLSDSGFLACFFFITVIVLGQVL